MWNRRGSYNAILIRLLLVGSCLILDEILDQIVYFAEVSSAKNGLFFYA
jgi:hypothetical protein